MRVKINASSYVPAPAKPDGFDAFVTGLRGSNPLGQPQWRVVWGMDRFDFRNEPKYSQMNPDGPGPACWILETWLAPAFYGTPEKWEESRYMVDDTGQRVDVNGPYPERGEYGLLHALVVSDGPDVYFIELCEEVREFLTILKANQDGFADTPLARAQYLTDQAVAARKREEEKEKRVDLAADIMAEEHRRFGPNIVRDSNRGGMIVDILRKRGPIQEFAQVPNNIMSHAEAKRFLKAQQTGAN